MRKDSSSGPLPALATIVLDGNHSDRGEIDLRIVLICIILMIENIEHLLKILVICISCLEIVLYLISAFIVSCISLVHLLLVGLLVVHFHSSSYVQSEVYLAKILSCSSDSFLYYAKN